MCGIAVAIHSNPETTRQAVGSMTDSLSHRGPDDSGADVVPFAGEYLGLGHRRLAIQDLSPLGRQPMFHSPTGCRLVFNGEIYNFQRLRRELELAGHRFSSTGDSEVLVVGLAVHGVNFLKKLEGMYAFAFFDPREQQLLVARDPAGIKPLYIAEISGGGFVLASEVRALLRSTLLSPKIDRRGVAGYLAYGSLQHPYTLFDGVTSLSPGSVTRFAVQPSGIVRRLDEKRFWSLPKPNEGLTETGVVPKIRATLESAVKDHLIADVPVGLFLSSGLDSTILAGVAAKYSPSLQSFTVSFTGQSEFSEHAIAARTAQRFGLRHTDVPVPMSEAESSVTDWLSSMDQPSIDGLNVYTVSRAVRSQGMKVALSGVGSDELFGGYPSFRDVPRLHRLTRYLRFMPAGLRRKIAHAATATASTAVRSKLGDMFGSDGAVQSLYLHRRRANSDSQLSQLGFHSRELGLSAGFLAHEAMDDCHQNDDLVHAVSQLEFRQYQGNMLLRDADVNGMAFGLEIRVPFLDQRILDLVHAVPGDVRVPRRGPGKFLLRKAFGDILDKEILDRPKQGFSLPIGRWMAGSLRPLCERANQIVKDLRLVNPTGADSVWRAFITEPESPMWSRAFAVMVLGEYVRLQGAA